MLSEQDCLEEVSFVEKVKVNIWDDILVLLQDSSLRNTLGSFFLFIFVHFIVALNAPSVISTHNDYFNITSRGINSTNQVDVTLPELEKRHRFVRVECRFMRENVIEKSHMEFETKVLTTIVKESDIILKNTTERMIQEVWFNDNSLSSTIFFVLKQEIKDFDLIQFKLQVTGDFTKINFFNFLYHYGNLSVDEYGRSDKLLMTILTCYMLYVYIRNLKFSNEMFTQVLCLVLGFSGIFALNPIQLFITKPSNGMIFSSYVYQAIFFALFRVFIISQIYLLFSKRSSPPLSIILILIIIFGIYSILQASASYDRNKFIKETQLIRCKILFTEKILVYFHYTYILTTCLSILLVLKIVSTSIKFFWHSTIILVTSFSTWYSGIYCVLTGKHMFSYAPEMVQISFHIVSAAFTLFFFTNNFELEYKKVQDSSQDNSVLTITEVDFIPG